jgi:DNA-binding NtrC family response regulator
MTSSSRRRRRVGAYHSAAWRRELCKRVGMPQARVLLVSADRDTRDLYPQWFARTANLATSCSCSPSDARAMLEQCGADLVLVDLTPPMPQWDEWLRITGTRDGKPPVVVLTGWVAQDGRFRRRAFALGCAAFVAKPCHPRVLVSVLRRVLDGERHIAIGG